MKGAVQVECRNAAGAVQLSCDELDERTVDESVASASRIVSPATMYQPPAEEQDIALFKLGIDEPWLTTCCKVIVKNARVYISQQMGARYELRGTVCRVHGITRDEGLDGKYGRTCSS